MVEQNPVKIKVRGSNPRGGAEDTWFAPPNAGHVILSGEHKHRQYNLGHIYNKPNQVKFLAPKPSPVFGLKYSRKPDFSIKAIDDSLICSAMSLKP